MNELLTIIRLSQLLLLQQPQTPPNPEWIMPAGCTETRFGVDVNVGDEAFKCVSPNGKNQRIDVIVNGQLSKGLWGQQTCANSKSTEMFLRCNRDGQLSPLEPQQQRTSVKPVRPDPGAQNPLGR